MPDLQYPVGKFEMEAEINEAQRRELIESLAAAPAKLRAAVEGLSPQQLDTPYRPGGWTVRQVVHHVPDSHLNCYTRFKLGLTEEEPTIKPYDENRWAELADVRTTPIAVSLALLDALHERWATLLRATSAAEFKRTFRHPDSGVLTLETQLRLYEWHGRHHTAHITSLRARMGW